MLFGINVLRWESVKYLLVIVKRLEYRDVIKRRGGVYWMVLDY